VRSLVLSLAALAIAAPAASAQDATLPLLGRETPAGTGRTVALPAVAPAAKTIDGLIGDWTGTGPGFAGTIVRSHGELLYTDHLFDAFGADDGRDAERLAQAKPFTDAVPEAYRVEALLQNDPAGQFGAPTPEQLEYRKNYGDLDRVDAADLSEVRLAPADGGIDLLARTTTLKASGDNAVLVLLDTEPGETERAVGFGTNLRTTTAELAAFITGATGRLTDLRTGETTTFAAATNADGWTNAVEARLPVADAERIAVAAAKPDGTVANVAFRTGEPVRENFDREQALALHAGTIDPFFTTLDLAALRAGASERYTPGPGYHERVFTSTEQISREDGEEGILQHYGVYLPEAYDPAKATPLQLWLHWRGGKAHSAGATIPGMFRDLGEAHDTMVVSPRGRGSSSWYVGRGHLDVEQVWADVHRTFRVDTSRRYVAGHSMGGFGSFLMTTTHPDWFAGALPASPPVTQGAWTGADFEGCDELRYDDYSPCYIQANDGDARAQHTRSLLENLRHTPVAIYHGLADELVPYSGVARQVERLVELQYRHRFYTFPAQEHFGPPVWDQWDDGGRYMHQFAIPAHPARISHVRDMPFERATERVNSGGATLDFDFGRNHWLRALEPADAVDGRAAFDATTLAVPESDPLVLPEAGGPASPGNTGPYTMTGLRWEANPLGTLPAARNAFTATLTGARAATLDLAGMRLDPARALSGTVGTDEPLALTLLGKFTGPTAKRLSGSSGVSVEKIDGGVIVRLPAGDSTFTIAR
jgi:hypothetical protein